MRDYRCDGCDSDQQGERVVFTTEATDELGVDVTLTKRWTTCPSCAEDVFDRIGEPSPFSDEDARTIVQPGEEVAAPPAGGLKGLPG